MERLSAFGSAVTLAAIAGFALAADFPTAPPNLKEMEAQGLHRVSAEAHYFDYDIANGFYAHVWRQSSEP